jgi:hypothetical protein
MIVMLDFFVRDAIEQNLYLNLLFYIIQKNIMEIIDLIYFWSIDINQAKVSYEAKTKSHDTIFRLFTTSRKLSNWIIRSKISAE